MKYKTFKSAIRNKNNKSFIRTLFVYLQHFKKLNIYTETIYFNFGL